jgi:hypothetical protein
LDGHYLTSTLDATSAASIQVKPFVTAQAAKAMDKAAVTAFDREKRVYKDAYVDNFRKVRYFPALASLGAAGHAQGASIVLVQEPQGGDGVQVRRRKHKQLESVPSRLLPPDSVRLLVDGLRCS